jgi:hypothetical protein
MGLNLRFSQLTSTATLLKHLSFSPSFRSDIIHLRSLKIFFEYQDWLIVISTLVFGVRMNKNKELILSTYLKLRSIHG